MKFTAFFLFAFSIASLSAQEFDIVLTRPNKVGDKCTYEGEFSEQQAQAVIIEGQPAQEHVGKVEGKVRAGLEVTKINKAGNLEEVKLTIESWDLQVDGKAINTLKAGDVVEGRGGRPSRFTLGGVPLGKEPSQALQKFFSLKTEDEKDVDDSVLGPGKKVKSGDSWAIHADAAAKELGEKIGIPMKPEMIKGIMKLDAVDGPETDRILKLSSHLSVNAAGLQIPGAPEGFLAQRFAVSVDMGAELPVDVTHQPLSGTEEVTTDVGGSNVVKREVADVTVKFLLSTQMKKKEKMDWAK